MKRAMSPTTATTTTASSDSGLMKPPAAAKKFRFDSFAEEFASKDEDVATDNDSGIGEFKPERY